MTRGKRTSAEVKAKIIEEKINTDWSARDIEQSTWIPHETIAKVLRDDFAQICTKNDKVSDLISRNNNLQSAADALIAEMIANKHESVTVAQLTTLRQSTFTQNQLLTWQATDRVDVTGYDIIKDISTGKIKRDDAYAILDQTNEEDS
jgi:hypothetical protein